MSQALDWGNLAWSQRSNGASSFSAAWQNAEPRMKGSARRLWNRLCVVREVLFMRRRDQRGMSSPVVRMRDSRKRRRFPLTRVWTRASWASCIFRVVGFSIISTCQANGWPDRGAAHSSRTRGAYAQNAGSMPLDQVFQPLRSPAILRTEWLQAAGFPRASSRRWTAFQSILSPFVSKRPRRRLW